jgi:uncharacterized protein (TIGR02246 family)
MTKTPKASDLGKEAMTDVTDLEAITRQFEAAWNAHDMQAFGELFAAEAIFVGRFATRLQGREAIVSAHQKIHETNYRDSTMTVDRPDVDLLTENIAILHFWTRLTTGPADPKGCQQIDTHVQAVVVRSTDRWKIRAAENVTLADPQTGRPILRSKDQ